MLYNGTQSYCFTIPSFRLVWIGDALLSDTVQLDDVLWGLYHFLDTHPTETIFASLKVDHGDPNAYILQETFYNLTSAPVVPYWTESSIVSIFPFEIHTIFIP